MTATSPLDVEKGELRRAMKARRAAAFAAAPEAGHALASRIFAAIHLPPGAPCSGFWPMGDELDLRPLLARLHFAGHAVGLPVVVKRGTPLLFRRWQPSDVLVSGGYGTSVPGEDKPVVTPEVLFVPLLAFDRQGYRLGYGGGFYDRTLQALRGAGPRLAVGVAFAAQEVEAVPRDHYDQKLDWIVTEAEAIRL